VSCGDAVGKCRKCYLHTKAPLPKIHSLLTSEVAVFLMVLHIGLHWVEQ
jgi:hypothetical protein